MESVDERVRGVGDECIGGWVAIAASARACAAFAGGFGFITFDSADSMACQ
jgi:hypothetical protein